MWGLYIMVKLTDTQRIEIINISKEFSKGILGEDPIDGTGWLVSDPLSGYLNFCGYKNRIKQIPEKDNQPQVLILEFEDGSIFVPAGKDLSNFLERDVENFTWID